MKNLVDLHTHSLFSNHAYSSVTENIDFAYEYGLKYYGISDHQPDKRHVGASFDNLNNLIVLPKEYKGMKIFKGVEINAGPNFHEFINNKLINRLDYGIASFHTYDYKAEDSNYDKNTDYYLETLNYDFIKIIGHIDDGRFPCDYEKIIKACSENRKLIEINNSSVEERTPRLNSIENCILAIKLCKKYSCPIILNSDAHIKYDIGNVDKAYELCMSLDFPDELIVNTNLELFEKHFEIK